MMNLLKKLFKIITTYKIKKHDWVDLGLPSGTKWATCNVGANNPWDYGKYYAWGETKPKSNYSWKTYKYGLLYFEQTKYCTNVLYGKNGVTDQLTTLEAADDAATTNWGGKWRMPTDGEWQELIEKCTWTWTRLNGVNGYEVKGQNGNSIFLPAAGGYFFFSTNYTGESGYYWSSSLDTDSPYYAWNTTFNLNLKDISNSGSRRLCGFSIRPVYKK